MDIPTVLVISSGANAASQLLLKMEARSSLHAAKIDIAIIIRLLRSARFIGGLFLFALSLSGYVVLISQYDIMIIFPGMGLTYVFVSLLSAFVLDERFDSIRIAGVALIVVGLGFLMAGSQ
ncbi:MAG: hypothetical protein ABJG86_17355 [Nitratireductor sp.]|jgi:drug/metabolite transporter (DMT)-like permease|uniref:hypothetical protein n=1 Tax=Alphaproteobacteria TaxID=28211 RepID=UPI0032670691